MNDCVCLINMFHLAKRDRPLRSACVASAHATAGNP